MSTHVGDLFTRDGHLAMLSLDRYDAGELDGPGRDAVLRHVEGCGCCRDRLAEIESPSVLPMPRIEHSRNAGVATISYLVATAVVSVAAATVLWIGATGGGLGASTAVHDVSEPALSAGSYTSVAQEFNEPPPPELAIDEQAERIVATAAVDGWLAVVALDGADSEDAPIVADVLVAPRAIDRAMSVGFARPAAPGSTVAVLCSSPPELVAGGRFEPAGDCVVRVLGGATSDR